MSTSLPTTRAHLTSLFASFPKDPPPSSEAHPNPLLSAPPSIKPLLLTLHVLFPNELLPALNLLDRKLVTRLVLEHPLPGHITQGADGTAIESEYLKGGRRTVYYVRSSQQPRASRFSSGRTYDAFASSGQNYEVRLKPWNCSCPAFAFAWVECWGDGGFEGLGLDDGNTSPGADGGGGVEGIEGRAGDRTDGEPKVVQSRFGGLVRGEGEMPVCKHLLACLLAESWKGFGGFVEERTVEREEMSGWVAGWGG